MSYFNHNDPLWEETAHFVESISSNKRYVLAPEEFVNLLPNVVAYELLTNLSPDFFDIVVLHKGQCLAMGGKNIELWYQNYYAVFSNAVFIVFCKNKSVEIDRKGDDFKALSLQIGALPDEPQLVLANQYQSKKSAQTLDYRPVINFLRTQGLDSELIVAPDELHPFLVNSIDDQSIMLTSDKTAAVVILTVNTVLDFPYQDLKSVSLSYTPIFSNAFFAVFVKDRTRNHKVKQVEFSEAVIKALQTDDYLIVLKMYQNMLLGKLDV